MRASRAKSTAPERPASRRAVNLLLGEGLVARALALTNNLSATVVELLANHVLVEETRRRQRDDKLDQVITALTTLPRSTGC